MAACALRADTASLIRNSWNAPSGWVARPCGRPPTRHGPRRRGGDSVLALKQNRPATLTEAEALFAAPPPLMAIGVRQTIDGGHGRIETRTHRVCHDVDWLFSDRRDPGEPAFPGLAMVGTVGSRTGRDGKVEQERRYRLCSAKLGAESFARAARSH